jgi:hypothetical protein
MGRVSPGNLAGKRRPWPERQTGLGAIYRFTIQAHCRHACVRPQAGQAVASGHAGEGGQPASRVPSARLTRPCGPPHASLRPASRVPAARLTRLPHDTLDRMPPQAGQAVSAPDAWGERAAPGQP